MFCLEHFFSKCIINKNYLRRYDHLIRNFDLESKLFLSWQNCLNLNIMFINIIEVSKMIIINNLIYINKIFNVFWHHSCNNHSHIDITLLTSLAHWHHSCTNPLWINIMYTGIQSNNKGTQIIKMLVYYNIFRISIIYLFIILRNMIRNKFRMKVFIIIWRIWRERFIHEIIATRE